MSWCVVCHSTQRLQRAHLVARSESGKMARWSGNVVVLCRRCHLTFDTIAVFKSNIGRWRWHNRQRWRRYRKGFRRLLEHRALIIAVGSLR